MTGPEDLEKSGSYSAHSPTASDESTQENDLAPVETNNVRPACFKSTIQEVLFVLTATMAIAMGALLTGSITVISSFIGRDLDMSTAQITWISSASTLTSGAFLLFFGRVADLFGVFSHLLDVFKDVTGADGYLQDARACS